MHTRAVLAALLVAQFALPQVAHPAGEGVRGAKAFDAQKVAAVGKTSRVLTAPRAGMRPGRDARAQSRRSDSRRDPDGKPAAQAGTPADTKPMSQRSTSQLAGALRAAAREDRSTDVRVLAARCVRRKVAACALGRELIASIRGAKPLTTLALLQAGTSPEARDEDGESALALAAEKGNAAVVKALLHAGANPDARLPEGDAAIHRAAAYGRTPIIDALVAEDADVNAKIHSNVRRNGWTPLMVAVAEGQPAVVERLLEAGAEVDARNARGRTALLLAAWYGARESVERLLRAGANPAAKDAVGFTPARVAALAGDPTVMGFFRTAQGR